jgi:type II secretory ATPase GspE/PulE/Tfp pilus assembly ATPase PilB-like protein
MEQLLQLPYGLILVVGPTGSGKTTTLHAALGFINKPEKKIWTAEDPVEIMQDGLRQVQVKPHIGLTFARVLRAFLRADPDVIMVGETRDEETATTAIEASLTGHLVFSTLHTNSAPETVTRLLGMGMDPFNFADALLGVLAQRLVKRLCPKCREAYQPDENEKKYILHEYGSHPAQPLKLSDLNEITLYKAKGCQHCNKIGYRGRLAIHELLVSDDGLKTLIQEKRPVGEIRDYAMKHGMCTLKQDGIQKVLRGDTDIKQVKAACIR